MRRLLRNKGVVALLIAGALALLWSERDKVLPQAPGSTLAVGNRATLDRRGLPDDPHSDIRERMDQLRLPDAISNPFALAQTRPEPVAWAEDPVEEDKPLPDYEMTVRAIWVQEDAGIVLLDGHMLRRGDRYRGVVVENVGNGNVSLNIHGRVVEVKVGQTVRVPRSSH